MSFRIVYREAGIQTTDETGVGSEASFNVGDAERDGFCTPSSTVSAGAGVFVSSFQSKYIPHIQVLKMPKKFRLIIH